MLINILELVVGSGTAVRWAQCPPFAITYYKSKNMITLAACFLPKISKKL